MNNKRKICIVTGSRAEYDLLYNIIKEISRNKSLRLQLIVTGMHLSAEFGNTYKKIISDKIKIDKKLKIIQKKVFIKFKNKDGSPDGMTLDNQNNLWICHFGGACISVFNKTGKKIHKIDLPAKNITNCTFGGLNNSELFVTSAKKSMSKKDLRKFKLSGSLFRIKTNVNGSIAKRFNYNI